MANTVKLKRSSVQGKTPTTGDLALGELALNTYDGNLFFKRDVSGTESIVSLATVAGTQTLTNKTISLGSNTITGTLAQFNTAITDADIADATHKYHQFTLNTYYYDSYTQDRFFRLFTQNATYDTARYSPITNVEYWNGTAWVVWVGGDAYIKNLLDGRDDTYADIDHTHRKFRFTINKNSGWPTNALIATYFSWFGNGWTPYTLTIEDTADSVTWVTKETLTFGNTTNTNADYGWHAFYSGNLHNGRTLNRITYDLNDWVDSGGYVTKRLYAFNIFSNYSGASDSIGVPVSWNYDKVVNFSAVPTVGGVQLASLTASQTLTNKTLTSPSINGGALSGTFSGAVTLSDTTTSISTTTGALKVSGGVGVAGTLNAASLKVNNAYTLPTADGSLNYVMSTDGTGQLSFIDVNSLISLTTQTANFSYSQDLGLVSQTVTSIGDLGALIDPVSTSYEWGTLTSGNIYPDEFVLPSYTISTLPTVQTAGQMLYVSNESGGAVVAFSDGTNWRRVTDRVIVS